MRTPEQEFLLGGKRTSASFAEIGTLVKGIVQTTKVEQQRDFTTGDPVFYEDGNPKRQLVIALLTDQRDPDIEYDDGLRHIFAKAGSKLHKALTDAIRAAGTDDLHPGDELAVKYTGDGEPAKRGLAPPKLYKAQLRVGVAPPPPPTPAQDTPAGFLGQDPDEDPF